MFWRLLHDHLLMIIFCFSDICSTKNQEQISWSISLETPPVSDSALVPNKVNLVPNKVNLVPNKVTLLLKKVILALIKIL
jgi:hypothetical protein